jgi:hypothetical protein
MTHLVFEALQYVGQCPSSSRLGELRSANLPDLTVHFARVGYLIRRQYTEEVIARIEEKMG